MVTAVTPNPKLHHHHQQIPPSRRPPLLPSDSDNAPPLRRAKAREVTSRYLSLSSSSSSSNSTNTTSSSSSSLSISSKRPQSPMIGSRASVISTPKTQQRSVSADRRRLVTPTPSNAERTLVTSMRSLSVSFQGEAYSVQVSKVRKSTPERRKVGNTPVRDGRENSKPIDLHQQQHRWPGARLRAENSSFMSRSLDYGVERGKLSGSAGGLDKLRKSMDDGNRVGAELKLDSNNFEAQSLDPSNSEAESVPLRGGPRKLVVPPRFGQIQDPATPLARNAYNRLGPSKLNVVKKFPNDSPVASPRVAYISRGLSPMRGGVRAASPSKASTPSAGALVRGMSSPVRHRVGVGNSVNDSNTCSTPSMLRGKLGGNRIADAHELRLLYNRQLQWRFANARAENSMLVQKHAAERSLYSARLTTSKLRHSVKLKRIELQLFRQNMKLYSVLKDQEPHLENWGQLDLDHANSLSGAIEALEANTVRLPVVAGARADVQKVKKAIFSAVDVMHAMASSICPLLMKVEQMNLLASELSNLSARERALLDEWRDLLSTEFIPLQVMHCSLMTHVLQAQRLPSNEDTVTQ